MKYLKIILALIVCAVAFILVMLATKDSLEKRTLTAHQAFIGDTPKPQPAYNITDYIKNSPHSNPPPKQ